ncbi:hypothetical protein H9P43_003572 [Blastocladiella emersonii ATCC 22665]|nr:hypothetical protein H9P43_003572 [Blastocladiella emersonii ATCC 22665]
MLKRITSTLFLRRKDSTNDEKNAPAKAVAVADTPAVAPPRKMQQVRHPPLPPAAPLPAPTAPSALPVVPDDEPAVFYAIEVPDEVPPKQPEPALLPALPPPRYSIVFGSQQAATLPLPGTPLPPPVVRSEAARHSMSGPAVFEYLPLPHLLEPVFDDDEEGEIARAEE